jgi:hypothetical protein
MAMRRPVRRTSYVGSAAVDHQCIEKIAVWQSRKSGCFSRFFGYSPVS